MITKALVHMPGGWEWRHVRCSYLPYGMKWQAIDEDTYDGPGCFVGTGATQEAAVQDLVEQLEDDR